MVCCQGGTTLSPGGGGAVRGGQETVVWSEGYQVWGPGCCRVVWLSRQGGGEQDCQGGWQPILHENATRSMLRTHYVEEAVFKLVLAASAPTD